MTTNRDARLSWWMWFGLFALLASAWALAAPLFSGPDEGAHVERAAAVVRGQLVGRPATTVFGKQMVVRVPEAYRRIPESACYYARPATTPSCAPAFNGGRRLVSVLTYEYRNPPLYYAFVGIPSLIWPAAAGVYLMRLLGAMLCASLLASAVASARMMARPRLMTAGVLLAATPAAVYFAGTVNPSSVEIVSAVCAWAAALLLALGTGPVPGRIVARFGVALAILATTRPLSPLFAGVILATGVALAPQWRRRVLGRRGDLRRWLAVALAAVLGAAAWTIVVARPDPVAYRGIGLVAAVDRTGEVFRQSVGVFGSLDVPSPVLIPVIWATAVVVAVLGAVVTARRRDRWPLVALTVLALLLPVTSAGFGLPRVGFAWQGRFGLPLLAGVVLVAAAVARPPQSVGSWKWPVLAALGAAQVLGFAGSARRYAVGSGRHRALLSGLRHPSWRPPLSPLTLLMAFAAAQVGVVLLARRDPVPPARPLT